MTIPIPERNRQILQMLKEGVSRKEVARRFGLSPSRIWLIERRDRADRSMGESLISCGKRSVRQMTWTTWPVEDLTDAIGLVVVTKKRLLDHFEEIGKKQMSLRELLDMCLDSPSEGRDWMSPALLRVSGVGKIGFWSVVNSLTNMDLGSRCNEEWRKRLVKVKQKWGITGRTPYSLPAE